ncbi:MAG: alpha-L-fucosidase [Labilibaculum antarcticum]
MMNRLFIISLISVVVLSCKQVTPPEACLPVPSKEQLAWHQMEMNAFIHFTTNTFTNKEWGYGDESPEVFNPDTVNAGQWVNVLKDAGFKGVILTCKHHDGFCLWPSKYTNHTIAQSPYLDGNGDVVKQLKDACTSQGVKFGVYLSPWDRNRSDYGEPSYIEYYRNQLKELFTTYGPAFEMWFDGANGGDGYYGGANEVRKIDKRNYYDWPTTLELVRSIQKDVIFFSDAGPGVRWCGNESGYVNETCWSTITTDTLYAGKAGIEKLLATGSPDGNTWLPAEVDVSIRPGWFYHSSEDSLVKSGDQLFDIYLKSVGRGALLLLNVPPDRKGVIHENDVKALEAFRNKLDRTFKDDLTKGAEIKASNTRGNSADYQASNVLDKDRNTYWCTDDAVTKASVEINLKQESALNYLVLQEYIKLGQRIKGFTVELKQGGEWKKVAVATTIAYKRIIPLNGRVTDQVRIIFEEAKACPVISTLGIF